MVCPLRFCHGHGIDWSNWIVGVVLLNWLLERWQSVNDCNEQKECDLKGNERRRGFRSKIHQPCLTIFGDDDSHSEINWHRLMTVVVVLPNLFRGMGARRNSTETQQSGHTPRSGP